MYVLNENILKLRNQLGMTQEDLAKKAGVSKATISNYENDITRPTCSTLTLLSDALGVAVNDLLNGSVAENGLDEMSEYRERISSADAKSPCVDIDIKATPYSCVYCDENGGIVILLYSQGECMMFDDFKGDKILIDDEEKFYIIDTKSDEMPQYKCGDRNIGRIISTRDK